jgi:hypothetical protein
MTASAYERAVNVRDHAVAYVAQTQVFNYGEDFVEVSLVSDADLAACAEGRFVPPGGQWQDAVGKLGTFGALIVTGERGSGRRTAALRLLNAVSADGPIYEFAPTWKRPGVNVLPIPPSARCLLDMSEPAIEPAPTDFGKKLLDWARENGICLVVTATDETGGSRWVGSAGSAMVRLRSPNARELAACELRASGAGELRTAILDNPAFENIWKSAPKAEDARRLAQLIFEGTDRSPEEIADEYQGWREWIDKTLPDKNFGTRALMWAAAFCDGGQRRSVLRMSEDLRRRLQEDRGPAAILSDIPSSKRLTEAEIERNGDMVRLSPARHGLAEALRAYLWDEFEDQKLRDMLTDWLVAQLGELPFDDAECVARGVLDMVIRFRDDALLRALRDKLTGDKRPIAVRTLSQAALDPRFGAHVRASLYAWAKTSRSQADLVAEVCGGAFGDQQPEMALVRLGWAAQNSLPDSPALASAVASLAGRHPEAVLTSIAKWFDDDDRLTAGVNSFLALASTSAGASLLCGRAGPASGQPGFRDVLVGYFQRSLSEPSSYDAAISVLEDWEKFSADGAISSRTAISVLGRALEPAIGKNPMSRLHPGFPDMDSFWGQAFEVAIRGENVDQESDAPGDPLMAPEALARQDTDAAASAYAPAAPSLQADAGTDAGAEAG